MKQLANQMKPLFAFQRGPFEEVVVSGLVAAKEAERRLLSIGSDVRIPVRSLLKPWQFLAQGRNVEDAEEMAIAVASHFGQSIHVNLVQKLLDRYQISPDDLGCPACFPMDSQVAFRLTQEHQDPRREFHPCSGKHLQMLVCCDQSGWSREGYMESNHPLQVAIRERVEGEVGRSLDWVADSCGLPTAVMTLDEHLAMWKRWLQANEEPCVALRKAVADHPELVGGNGRLDTEIIRQSHGKIIAKEGADGLLVCHDGEVGFLVKIASGYSTAHLGLALHACLEKVEPGPKHWGELTGWLGRYRAGWLPKDQSFHNLVSDSENF